MLKLQEKDKPSLSFWLIEPQVTIGASVSNSIVIEDSLLGEESVVIKVEGEALSFTSAASWVRVNGKAPALQQSLRVGDNLQLGRREFIVVDPKAKQVPANVSQGEGWYLWNEADGKRFEIKAGAVLGRASDCSICISDPHLSRRHARFCFSEDALLIEDLGSSNGTFVNGKKIKTKILKKGDEIRFDKLTFLVRHSVYEDPNRTAVRPIVMADMLAQAEAKQAAERAKKTSQDNAHRSAVVIDKPLAGADPMAVGQNKGRAGLVVGVSIVVLVALATIFWVVGDRLV